MLMVFDLGFIVLVLIFLWYMAHSWEGNVSHDDYKWDSMEYTNKDQYNRLMKHIRQFNRDDIRYLFVEDLPAIEDVVDRRAVYVQTELILGRIFNYTMYTCVSGVWVQLEDIDINLEEFLGRV